MFYNSPCVRLWKTTQNLPFPTPPLHAFVWYDQRRVKDTKSQRASVLCYAYISCRAIRTDTRIIDYCNYPLYTVHYTHFIPVVVFYTATDMFRTGGFVFRDFRINYISQ